MERDRRLCLVKCLITLLVPVTAWEFRSSPSSQRTEKLPTIRMLALLAGKRSAVIKKWVNSCRVFGLLGWAARSGSTLLTLVRMAPFNFSAISPQLSHSSFPFCSVVWLEVVYFHCLFLHLIPMSMSHWTSSP